MQIDRGAHPKYTNRLRRPAVLLPHQNGVRFICQDHSFGSFQPHRPVKAYSEPIVYPCEAYRRSSWQRVLMERIQTRESTVFETSHPQSLFSFVVHTYDDMHFVPSAYFSGTINFRSAIALCNQALSLLPNSNVNTKFMTSTCSLLVHGVYAEMVTTLQWSTCSIFYRDRIMQPCFLDYIAADRATLWI